MTETMGKIVGHKYIVSTVNGVVAYDADGYKVSLKIKQPMVDNTRPNSHTIPHTSSVPGRGGHRVVN